MRRFLVTLGLATALASIPVVACAHDAYDDSESHPLRIAAYGMYPIGFALEWLVTRPMHFVVSQPQLERVFGHTPHEYPFGLYPPYEPDEETGE